MLCMNVYKTIWHCIGHFMNLPEITQRPPTIQISKDPYQNPELFLVVSKK